MCHRAAGIQYSLFSFSRGRAVMAGCWWALEGPRLAFGLSRTRWRVLSVWSHWQQVLGGCMSPASCRGHPWGFQEGGGESLREPPKAWDALPCMHRWFPLSSVQNDPSSVSLTHVLAGVGKCEKEYQEGFYLKLPSKRGSKTGKGVMLHNFIGKHTNREAYEEKPS